MSKKYYFDMIYKDKVTGEIIVLYPKTSSRLVILYDGSNLTDHVNSDCHKYSNEKELFGLQNKPNQLVTLDRNGYLPLNVTERSLLAVKTEYQTIDDMIKNGSKQIDHTLCFVADASEDPVIAKKIYNNENILWAIYRKLPGSTKGINAKSPVTGLDNFKLVNAGQFVDVPLEWTRIMGTPNSSAENIDKLVRDSHKHINKQLLDSLDTGLYNNGYTTETYLRYKKKEICYEEDLHYFLEGQGIDYDDLDYGDFWLKSSYCQEWWIDPSIEDAGTTCYEKYANQDTLTTAPRIRTLKTNNMCRMFYNCTSLVNPNQYYSKYVTDFTGMYQNCSLVTELPVMFTRNGKMFDRMFYGCSSLKYSPELQLDNAVSAQEMFSGCSNMEKVNIFGSTKNLSTMKGMFNNCSLMKKIYDPIDFTSIKVDDAVKDMFNNCLELETVEFVPGTLKVSISLANTNLSRTCILAILEGLPTVTNGKSINLYGIPALSNMTEDDLNIATKKGWTVKIS